MGNQINMITSVTMAENRGFEVLGSNPGENRIEEKLKNLEISGYHMNSDPAQRDYFTKCPKCHGLLADNGLCETIKCDNCKSIINIPENSFSEIKQANLFNQTKKKNYICKYIKEFCSKISNFIPFMNNNHEYILPSYKIVTLYINEEKLANSSHAGENFSDIMNIIILPFFQFKSRMLNKDKIFVIDDVEFKVISVFPHYLTGKISSKTAIICNNFYSHTIPLNNVTLITLKKREFEANEYIISQIKNTPYPSQLCLIEGLECRINTYDLFVRNCNPKYGIITNDTNIVIINRNIEMLKSVKIAILHNDENPELNDPKNEKTIFKNLIKPFLYDGNRKFIERGDVIKISNFEIFILQAKPSTGFLVPNSTKIYLKMNMNLEECHKILNDQIEQETINENSERNNLSTSINTNFPIINENNNRLIALHERLRLLNELFANRGRLMNIINRAENIENGLFLGVDDYIQHQAVENTLRSLPVFKIDEKFIEISKNKENSKKEQFNKCIICMENYEIGDEVETLPCFHLFHKECIDKWFKSNKDSCPICKNKISNREDDYLGDFDD